MPSWTEHRGPSYQLKTPSCTIVVLPSYGNDEKWMLDCPDLNILDVGLESDELENAQQEALEHVLSLLEQWTEEISKCIQASTPEPE